MCNSLKVLHTVYRCDVNHKCMIWIFFCSIKSMYLFNFSKVLNRGTGLKKVSCIYIYGHFKCAEMFII